MASELQTTVWESNIRIVLLGDTRADKSELAKLILGCKTLKGQENGLCTLYKTEETGRKISVVDTPGWNPISIEQTTENIKSEIVRSVSLCTPGPDVFLLVIPVKHLYEESSMYEISEAQKHMELLSERVWKHTIVLFDCEKGIEETVINKHIQSAKTILEKSKRSCVYRRDFAEMTKLFNEIEILMLLNNREFFMPQMYSEKTHPRTGVFDKEEPRQRRRSMENNPPGLRKENDTEEKKETVEAAKHGLLDVVAALHPTIKPFSVILMGIFGALIGAVAGSEHGALGACAGLVSGIIVGISLAVLTIYICSYIYSES